MSIKVDNITVEQQKSILKAEEGHFCDLKSEAINPAKLTQTLSAFANATGGELYVGIDEERKGTRKGRKWRGFADQEAANGHIQALEQLFPLGDHFTYSFLCCEGSDGLILKVEVHKTSDIKTASNGIPYLRRGAQNLPVDTTDKIERLKLNKGITSHENETVGVDYKLIENSPVLSKFLSAVVPSAEPDSWLKSQLLIREGKPTVAAILLFAEVPQAILPKHCGIKIYRYKTRERVGSRQTLASDPITIEGCLYDSIRDAVSKTVEIIEKIPILGLGSLEPIKYPNITLHEIITNAVLHRDYSIATDIKIRIFDNRIEVESPGKLPGLVTVENILTEQCARNSAIVRLINKFPDPPNKDVGEGLNTAFDAMTQLRLKAPEIKEFDNSLIVYIRHESLASPEEAVMQYLETHDAITNTQAREITGITSENVMKQVFYRLRSKGLIDRVPRKYGPSSAWQKVGRQMRMFQ